MDEHHYLIRGGLEGRERLRVIGRVMRPATLLLLERAGVSAGMRCLDVGCGGGDVTFDLASLVGLTGHVLGLDFDTTKVELARADAEQVGVTNVEFQVADVTQGLGEAAYDVVYARFLLTHLRDPAAELELMRTALRPGGRLVVEDIDHRGVLSEPMHPVVERFKEIYDESARRNGGDPWIGVRLPAMVVAAGFQHVQTSVVQPAGLDDESKLLHALTLENIKAVAIRDGVATAEEIDPMVDQLYALAADPLTFMANPRIVQIVGEKIAG